MDPAARGFPPGDLRVSDAERDLALSELSEAFQVGRITAAEFDERSGLAVRARTGKELTALLADLPPARPPAARPAAARPPAAAGPPGERADSGFARRVTIGASVAATAFAAVSVGNALDRGPDLQQREALQRMLNSHGFSVPLPPAQGFDWAGTLTPAVIALLLVLLIVGLRLTRPRGF
jgi:Domain of unknown function (DUF1707)